MLLWIVFAGLSALAVALVAAPLARARTGEQVSATSADLEVYKAQLGELERDQSRGVIGVEEAASARIEISRRLLAEEDRIAKRSRAVTGAARPALLATVIAVPVLAVAGYVALGSPNLPGQPMSARIQAAAENQDMELLVARVEKHLSDNPRDGRGWEVLGPVYRRMGRFDDAARAYANALRLQGETAEMQADYGEMLVASSDGLVGADAQTAFERALELDSEAIKPRFFLAIAKEQDGNRDAAIAAWNSLLALSQDPAGAWRERVRQRLASLGAEPGPGPTSEQVAAAQEMSADDRQQMIEGMVSQLAERLESGEGTLEEWLRLIRAYGVLGRDDEARETADKARAQFAGDDAALGRIDAESPQAENES
ncbi:c-type cytochrome biogenesis protein CcmI [Tepidamorphus sp. 3E244]|uniref:c-type cytochrome biogenesis protein CcmI n=1 Tax=Tepidamorphus sp. 3E244 TaxID=3385498 RepID=UPI0038FC1E83